MKYRAKLSDNKYDTLVEVGVSGWGINYVKVYPSKNSYSLQIQGLRAQTGGLCGKWSTGNFNPPHCDLFIYEGEQNNQEKCIPYKREESFEFVNYWK